jgi:hypothetical protein
MPHHRRARGRARHLAAPALVAGVALATACAEIGSDPNAVVSVEFNRLPSPGILAGDTLRTLEGEPALVRDSVKLFDQESDPIGDAGARSQIRFVVTVDSARIRWDSTGGYLLSTAATGLRTVGVQAQVGGLYPPPVTLNIVPFAPTSLTLVDADTNPIAFGISSAKPVSVMSEALTVRLAARDSSTGGDSLVTGWPVEFRVVSFPASIDSVRVIAAATDTARGSRPSPYDTTATGSASRLLAAWRKAGTPIGAADTIVVRARYRVRRALRDSVQWRIPLVALAAP